MLTANLFQHHNPASRSAVALAWKSLRRHDQPVAFSTSSVPVLTQLGFLAAAFARQQCIRIGGRIMRLVGPCLALKINGRIPSIVWRRILLVLAFESSSGWPRLR